MAKHREEELCQQLTVMKAGAKRVGGPTQEVVDIYAFWGQPFNEEINRTPIPANFRELVVDSFDGTQDSHAYLQAFQTKMYISRGNDALSCKLFLSTMRGVGLSRLVRFIYGGDKGMDREAHRSRGRPSRLTRSRMSTLGDLGDETRYLKRSEKRGELPDPTLDT
ncbi:hypothetical protein CR513_09021, partial [Mucuna pruriens]